MSSIRLLKTFLAVADEGSFAAAAPRVSLTQAAVGQQMRALEGELNRPLFERHGKAVALSPEGRELLPQVRRLAAQWEQLLVASPVAQAMVGTVHLGAVVSAVRPLIQATLALKTRHPALQLHVSAAKSAELLERVAGGTLDAAIVVREPGAAVPALAWTPLYSEPVVVLAPRKLEPASLRTLLHAHPFIRFDASQHTGRIVDRALRRLRAKPQEVLELNAIEAIVELVRSGLGVTLVPHLRGARWASDPRLQLIGIPGAEERRIALVQRRDFKAAAMLATVTGALRQELLQSA